MLEEVIMDFTRAEELIKKKKENLFIPERVIDYKKLLYELRLQQTELELQNEALREAGETAEVTLKKYTKLFDLAAMGYFLLDFEGTICELNFTGADMLRERRFTLKGSNFKLFVSDDSKMVFNYFYEKIYTSNAKESCKIMLGFDENQFCKVYMEGTITEGEQNCLLSVVNLSKFQNAG